MMETVWDLVVVGAGPGGYVAAIRAAQLGLKTAVVERRPPGELGGTCLNEGCIPSKALLESSWRYAQASSGAHAAHGIGVGDVTLDLAALMGRKADVVAGLSKGIAGLFKKYKVTAIQGEARLAGEGRVLVGESEFQAKCILLCPGSRPVELPGLPFDGERVISSAEALALTKIPKRLVVVGGGVIGLEMGSIWSRLGAEVTVVEALPEILPGIDVSVVRQAKRLFRKQGLTFLVGSKVTGVMGDAVSVTDAKGKKHALTADKVLVAVGRRPNAEGWGAETDENGFITVDDDYQTSLPGVFAVGDVIPGPMLAHKAMKEGVACVERMAGLETTVDYGRIPGVVYTHPEIAVVGRSEAGAKKRGIEVTVGQFPFLANGRARAGGEADGVVRVVAEKESGQMIGVHMLGPHVSELVAAAETAIGHGLTAAAFAEGIFPHPSLSEALEEAALAATGHTIHL